MPVIMNENNTVQSDFRKYLAETKNMHLAFHVVHIVIGVLTVPGNALVILTMILSPQMRRSSSVFLLTSLAAADLGIGLMIIPCSIRQILANSFPQPWSEAECVACVSLLLVFCAASFLSVAIITFERFIKIVYPHKHHIWMKREKMLTMTFTCWLIPGIVATFLSFWNTFDPDSICFFQVVAPWIYQVAFLNVSIVIDVLCTAVFYALIVYRLVKHRRQVETSFSISAKERLSSGERRVNMAVMAVVGLLLLVVSPYAILGFITPRNTVKYHVFRFVAETLVWGTSIVNPIVYALKIPGFRQAFRDILCCRRPSLGNQAAVTRGTATITRTDAH